MGLEKKYNVLDLILEFASNVIGHFKYISANFTWMKIAYPLLISS